MTRSLREVQVKRYTFDTYDGPVTLARIAWIMNAYEAEINDGTGWKTINSTKATMLVVKLIAAGADASLERTVHLDLLDWDSEALTAALAA